MSGEEFLLKWNDHHNSFFTIMQDLCSSETLTDVTLACGGRLFETHKIMLCVCSPFFRSILARPIHKDRFIYNQHPIVFLKDIQPKHLEQLLQYMYHGEINVMQEDLAPLIEAARALQIKGLSDAPTGTSSPPPLSQSQPSSRSLLSGPPPMKKAGGVGASSRLSHLAAQHINKRVSKNESLSNNHHVYNNSSKPNTKQSNNNSTPQLTYSLPTEPDPTAMELIKEEQLALDQWAQSDPDISQSGGSDYEVNPDVYSDQMDDEPYFHGSQVKGSSGGGGGIGHVIGSAEVNSANTKAASAKRHECGYCGKRFPTPSKLQRHSLIHTGEKPYSCEVCHKGFTQLSHLKNHQKYSHGPPKSNVNPTTSATKLPNPLIANATISLPTEPIPQPELSSSPPQS